MPGTEEIPSRGAGCPADAGCAVRPGSLSARHRQHDGPATDRPQTIDPPSALKPSERLLTRTEVLRMLPIRQRSRLPRVRISRCSDVRADPRLSKARFLTRGARAKLPISIRVSHQLSGDP